MPKLAIQSILAALFAGGAGATLGVNEAQATPMGKIPKSLLDIFYDADEAKKALDLVDRIPVGGKVGKDEFKKYLSDIKDESDGIYGLRFIPEDEEPKLKQGSRVKNSRVWRSENEGWSYDIPTDRPAKGPSALSLGRDKDIEYAADEVFDRGKEGYYGNPHLLVSGEENLPLQAWNIDKNEIVMNKPRVLAGFKPEGDSLVRYRSAIPYVVGAGVAGSAMGGPENAQAAMQSRWDAYRDNPEKPLEDPVWSPVDLAVAPIGSVGAGAKAIAMALDPALSVAMDSLATYGKSGEDDKQRIAKVLEMFGSAGAY